MNQKGWMSECQNLILRYFGMLSEIKILKGIKQQIEIKIKLQNLARRLGV